MTLKRSHFIEELIEEKMDQTVTVCGWVNSRRDHGGVVFIDVRDGSGILQLVFNPQINAEVHELSNRLRSEFVIAAKGKLHQRSEETVNTSIPTGKIELEVDILEILNESNTPPFEIDDNVKVDESLRLQYRYLDLRRPELQNRIKFRHKVAQSMRRFLDQEGFFEVETPTLIKTTPEGARDYLVPSRTHPNHFYALPQSPQIYKQLLMMSGFERYFQIARCYRDEDLRADRQPEFTQLDMEMSFVDEQDVRDLNERMVAAVMKDTIGYELPLPLPVLTYEEAMNRFGSDKPDMRFELEFINFSDIMATCGFKAFKSVVESGGVVKGLLLKNQVDKMSRHELDKWRDKAIKYGAKGLVWIKFEGDEMVSPVVKFFTPEEQQAMRSQANASSGDILFLMADKTSRVHDVMGRLRLDLGERLDLIDKSKWSVLWVNAFPMFEWNDHSERWQACHHPFTMPREEDIHLLDDQPEKVLTQAYDLVINGVEMSSGSIRVHDRELQEKIFQVLNISEEEAQAKFGFLLKAFSYGPPPHGGMGLGFDRFVMSLAGVETIRDVIAFPKTNTGACLMTGAPGVAEAEQLDELYLKMVDPE